MRTFDLRQIVIPNTLLIDSPIKTFSAEEIVRMETVIGVHYDTDLELAQQVVEQAIKSLPFLKVPERAVVMVDDFADSSIQIKCLFFVDPNTGMLQDYIISEANRIIFSYCKANKITIPYPHTTISLEEGAMSDT